MVWEARRALIHCINILTDVKFNGLTWKSNGTGCCSGVGIIGPDTAVTCHFQHDISQGSRTFGPRQFQPVDSYVSQIAEEQGGIQGYARTVCRAALHRFDGSLNSRLSVGAVISGLPGVGKTLLAKGICQSLGVSSHFLNAADVFRTFVGHSEVELVKTFESAIRDSPSILVIDGVEAIATSRQTSSDAQGALEVGILGTLLACLDRIKSNALPVFVIATTTRPDDVDAAVISNGRLDLHVKIEPPSQMQRHDILTIMTKRWQQPTEIDSQFVLQLSEATGGYVGSDLLSLCQKAVQNSLNDASMRNGDRVLCPRHFEQALATTFPSALQAHHVSLRQMQGESTSIGKATSDGARSSFGNVVGLDHAIEVVNVSLIEPLEDCSRFLEFGTVPPKGILLTGPPGSGKSYFAMAVAEEVRRRGLASFVSVRCTDLVTKVVGDTEKALRELFATARNAAPCVLYFDQIESIAPVRGFDTSTEQTFDRMLSMLLVEMDGFGTSRRKLQQSLASDAARSAFLKEHVVIMASTTRKELLDPSILRPG